ncbi:hypothetical protein ACN6K9_001668 [Streptomyces sp. SAS_267]|uniref:hypothetical protein n=1 Tax=Streptomyces sp. SAS_267 TaxID=3412750 RepID=UPI00403CB384
MEDDDVGEDEDTGVTKVRVRVPLGTRLALTSMVERHQVWAQQLKAQHRAQLKGLTAAQRDILRAEQRQALRVLRSRGSLLDKRGLLIAFGVRQELRDRGWDHSWSGVDWQEIPMGLLSGGIGNRYPECLALSLPVTLVEQLCAGCWTSSKKSIDRLRKWHADHSAIVQSRARLLEGPAAEYERLAASVITAGDVYRAAIRRGLHAVLHAPTSLPNTALAPR